jgi:WD40 repeat protein
MGSKFKFLRGHEKNVLCVTFSPDGEKFASGSHTIELWDNIGESLKEIKGVKTWVCSICFSPDG